MIYHKGSSDLTVSERQFRKGLGLVDERDNIIVHDGIINDRLEMYWLVRRVYSTKVPELISHSRIKEQVKSNAWDHEPIVVK
jgi:hypothetical protein